ncbi:MAG: GGDEF domain-containing protein, partial [Desulfobacterales bacterium]|nr:GGDEF domain-containing protein [Desulfobacterales bacterium]
PHKKILDCNSAFLKLMNLPGKPHGQNIGFFMSADTLGSIIINPKDTQTCRECHLKFLSDKFGSHMLRCFVFSDEENIILLGEKLMPDRDDIVEKLDRLNNEFANMTLELTKKNIALEKAKSRIKELKRIDSLTGLLNRRSFHEAFNRTFSYTIRHNQPLSLSVSALDSFKSINVTYGHDMGDKVLVAFSGILQSMLRTEDIVCRFGGEEFILLIPGAKAGEASVLIERIRKTTEAFAITGFDVKITASFGIAQLMQTDTFESLLKRADEALYEAKSAGKNRWVIK